MPVRFGLVAALLAVSAALPASAAAHAAFQDASPEPGARLGRAPSEITLVFTEPLNRALTTARIVEARSGRSFSAAVSVETSRGRLLVHPTKPLPTGAFRVLWHTVSLTDGHALEGSFGFGVRTSAAGGEQRLEQSPLARTGWLRVALRGLMYSALFFFGGGLLCGLLLSRTDPAAWLVGPRGNGQAGLGQPERARRIWRRTVSAGWIAAAAAVGVALAETYDAASSLSWRALDAYLLSTPAGRARAVAAVALLAAALLARRASRTSALAFLAALAAVAFGGHANSASLRALALGSDWLHLLAAVVWAGGIAQIVVAWLPQIPRLTADERRLVMRAVLTRFGRVAAPAAVVVVAAGVVNALVELGRPSELWESAYGRVLIVKIALVGAIASASYVHAFRLRPRLLGAPGGWSPAEGRHWRLLRAEPALAVAVLWAAALLAVFPLPPRQLLERAEASGHPAATTALRAPEPGQLEVAEAAGPWIAAVSVGPASRITEGTVRLLDFNVHPIAATIRIDGARVEPCGRGCARFRTAGAARVLRVIASSGGRTHVAAVPIEWDPSGTVRARRVFRAAVAAMERLRSLQIAERLTTGLGGSAAVSRYMVDGRSRYSIVARNAGPSQTVAIGRRVWVRDSGAWQQESSSPVDSHDLLPWWTHRTGVRLIRISARSADIALADIPARGIKTLPFWFRLRIDLATMRVERMRMIAPAHFMDQRYFAFDKPVRVVPPRVSH
jgi:copper transport protein